jgi:hypothetical protein
MRFRKNKDDRELKRKDREDQHELAVDIDKSRHLGARLQMRFLEKQRSELVTQTTDLDH